MFGMNPFKAGDFVTHKQRPDYGFGKVLEVKGSSVYVDWNTVGKIWHPWQVLKPTDDTQSIKSDLGGV